MSGQAAGADAEGGGGGFKTRDDQWMTTVSSVSAFLAGFSLASVVLIASMAGSFRWPGAAVLALTIASVVLVGAAQGSRRGAYYYEDFREHWRYMIWVAYHVGIVALLAGLGAALVPVEGVGGQQGLRMAAAWVAFAAAGVEVVLSIPAVVKRFRLWRNSGKLAGLLRGRGGWQAGTQDGERCWYLSTGGARRLVITPKTDGFLIYRAGQDRSWVIPRTELKKQWLDEHERAGPDAVPEEPRRDLEEREAGSAGT